MERLLKKQESKASKVISKGKPSKRQVPLITYRLTLEKSSISLPPGEDFPLQPTRGWVKVTRDWIDLIINAGNIIVLFCYVFVFQKRPSTANSLWCEPLQKSEKIFVFKDRSTVV